MANPKESALFDSVHHENVLFDIQQIKDMAARGKLVSVTREDVVKAMKYINKGKSRDIYGLSIEHFLNTSESFISFLTEIIKQVFKQQKIPDVLKHGFITPVYKKKGSSADACNYRGITVLPIICKLIEVILRERLSTFVQKSQSCFQRGFTKNSSPLNCAVIIYEFLNELKDRKETAYIAFLDAKAAFDVVSHPHL